MLVAICCITCRGVQDRKTSGERINEKVLLNSENSTAELTDDSRSRSFSHSRSSSAASRSSYSIIVILRLLAAIGAAIAALSGLGNLLLMSLVLSLLLATIATMTSYSDPNSWMHSLFLLVSTVSKRAGLIAYYGLRVFGVIICVIQDMLLAVFFVVVIGITREIVVYYW